MSYNTESHITIGQLKTALTRVKTEYVAADETLTSEFSSGVASDDEVTEMLEEVFAETEE